MTLAGRLGVPVKRHFVALLAHAQCDTIRLKLLKLGAQVRVTVRNIWVSFSQSYPYAELFTLIYHRLRAPPGALT